MRYIYSFLFYLLLPFLFLRLLWRSFREPNYRRRLGERLGFYSFKLEKCIWVHAVSVGETIAALPLIRALKVKYPSIPILVTTMTPTGAQQVKVALGDEVMHVYLPYDLPGAMNRFLTTMNPIVGLIIETELWPNLLANCQKKHIPVCLLNARLSEKSARGYQRIASLSRAMLQSMHLIAAHSEVDAERFIVLGANRDRIVVTGNIKFDLELPADLTQQAEILRAQLGAQRFVWVAASTHDGEEEIILEAHKKLREKNPNALLILVPRHPGRFDAVVKLCEKAFSTSRRSLQSTIEESTAVYVGDTMGELLLMYAAADAAFIGGSLMPHGGHNMLEPAALNKPMLTGPHVHNFADIHHLFSSAKALLTVTNVNELELHLLTLMENAAERIHMGNAAQKVMNANRGALNKQLELVAMIINANLR